MSADLRAPGRRPCTVGATTLIFLVLSQGCRGDKAGSAAPETAADSAEDAPLPYGDNLTPLGELAPDSGPLEAVALLARDDGWTLECGGTSPLQVYDSTDPSAPALISTIAFPPPAGMFRCQHMAMIGEDRLVATHHGDETGAPWIGLADVGDLTAPVGLSTWSDGSSALEGVAVDGGTVYVAAHEAGIYAFDVSGDSLDDPTILASDLGNASILALRGDVLAVGSTEGDLALLDRSGALLGSVALSGPVHDLVWLDDETLVAACGASGLDRVDTATLSVTHHAETGGSALDLGLLSDSAVAVANWEDFQVYDGQDLALLGEENPSEAGRRALVLTLDASGDTLTIGEWRALLTYAWDPTVAAPDLALDVASVDLGLLDAGESAAAALVLRNKGPQDLSISAITSSDPALTVDRTALDVAAGSADFVELHWTSTGEELSATVRVESDDPDESHYDLAVRANRPGVGVGDPLPAFTYLAINGTETYDSTALGGPALLSYFATF